MDDLLSTLACPISYELIEDPIQLLCCGKSISREAFD